jgi:spermidine synthase
LFKNKTLSNQAVLLILCFLSGFSTLIFEVIWIRILSLVFGTTISAVAIVVAVFIAGLGIGSMYFGKKVDKTNNHLKFFSFLQFGIGISSLITLIIFFYLPIIYKSIYLTLNTEKISMLLIITLSTIIIFVPTFLMGGILPVLSKIFIKRREEIGKGVGVLYAVNTLGSIMGAFLTGFFFILYCGHTITLILSIAIVIILGFVSFFMSSYKAVIYEQNKRTSVRKYSDHIIKISLLVAGLSGFCALSYEILWTRSLHIFIANSTYSFINILIIFLTGISIGSFIFAKYLNNKKQLLLLLAICQTAIGVYVIITALFLNELPSLLFSIRNILGIPVLRIFIPGLLLSFVIAFLPTLFMGISFPLICKICTQETNNLGHNVGKVYFINTIGGIIGSLIAGFVLIPVFGVLKSIISVAFINLLLGMALIVLEPDLQRKTRFIAVNCCIIFIGIFLARLGMKNPMVLPPSMFRTATRSDKILYYKETPQGTVIVSEDRFTRIRACYINNSAVCGTTYDALKVVKMLGHLPFFINPDAQNALIIGFGIGITASAVAEHDVGQIDCIEICPGVKDAAKFFSTFNNDVIQNPKINFIGGDGRNYILLTNKKYDIISCDPTHPTLGCNNLYTKEYFQLCKSILNENGVMCQFLPLHKLSLNEFKILIKTFSSVFPHTTVWLAHSHGILVATDHEIDIDFTILRNNLEHLQDDILFDPYLFTISLLYDEDATNRFTKGATINTDNNPYLEFFTPNSIKRENWDINLSALIKFRIDPQKIITNIDDKDKLNRYLIA